MRVSVVTHYASPYQVELFNAIATRGVDLRVVYLHGSTQNRKWTASALSHETTFLDQDHDSFDEANEFVRGSDVFILNYYAESSARRLLCSRVATGKPWIFWGERPGFRKPCWPGKVRRRLYLAKLHQSRTPIWGIGKNAVDAYRAEFGDNRNYRNIPYFSDLARFGCAKRKQDKSGFVILFSGSLIHRKGVDLLARAFVRLAPKFPNVRLDVLGEGELLAMMERTVAEVHGQVKFIGFRDWQELPQVYAQADILCVPSRYDGWGLVVPEGLATGLPTIATNAMGAAQEFVKTGYNGWLISAGEEESLFAALIDAVTIPPERLSELSRNATESVKNHSLEHGAERFIQAAKDAINDWPG